MRDGGHHVQVLFFDASDDVLLRRFSETRRPHPSAAGGSVQDGISRERKALESIRALADKVIDTSDFNVHQLKREMEQQFCDAPSARRMTLFLTSFGYKFGIPHDTDVILDVRFLPNPYFVNELRGKSGLDREVEEYVLGNAETRAFLDRLYALLEFTLPLYEREGKSSLTSGSVAPEAATVPSPWSKSCKSDSVAVVCASMSSIGTSTNKFMSKIVKKIEIKNKLGVHARAAALLVQTVNKFSAQISFSDDGQTTDGRSILGVMSLGGPQGSKIQIEATGEDAEKAVKALEKLIDARFNESE